VAALVLDSSVALAWFMPDERDPRIEQLLDLVTNDGAVAPNLWPLEVANVLVAAERRRRITAAQKDRALHALQGLPVQLDAETAARAWTTIRALAELHRLTLYDAAYLELAIRLQLPLASLDRDLKVAAGANGIPVLGS
jgi:predicted nucleic acid-binding protein